MNANRFLPMICGCLLTVIYTVYNLLLVKKKRVGIDAKLWMIPLLLMVMPFQIVSSLIKPIVDTMPPINYATQTIINNVNDLNPPPFVLRNVVLVIWLVVALVLFMFFAVMYMRLHIRIYKSEQIQNPQINQILASRLEKLNVHREIKAFSLPNIKTPLLVGVFNAKIVFPVEMDWGNLKNIEFIMHHEITHYIRHDNLLKMSVFIMNIIMWWNPFIFIIRKHIEEACEHSCDLSVTKNLSQNDRKYYSNLLLRIIEKSKGMSPIISAFSQENKLIRRLELIMKNKKNRILPMILAVFGISLATVSTVFALAQVNSTEDGLTSRIINKSVYETANENGTFSYTANDIKYNESTGKYELYYQGTAIEEFDENPIEWQINNMHNDGIELQGNIEDYVLIQVKSNK